MNNLQEKIAALVSIFILIYIILRASFIPFTFDEVQTFAFYIEGGEMQPFYSRLDANNHVINSALAHVSYLLFGKSPFALRLPNVLSFLLFVIYLIRFSRFFKDKTVWLLLFLSLCGCHFLIDFFGLCRGYGLSMAFMVASLYHTFGFLHSRRLPQLALACIFLSLAFWSNLSLLVFAFALLALLTFSSVNEFMTEQNPKRLLLGILIIVALLVLPLSYAAFYSIALQKAGVLYFGSDVGFWHATVGSLTHLISEGHVWGKWLLYMVLMIYLLAILKGLGGVVVNINSIPMNWLLWSTILGTVMLHIILQVKYPLDRAAIHFIVLLMISFYFMVDGKSKWLVKLSSIVPVLLVGHFVSAANTSYSHRWKTEVVPLEFYNEMIRWKHLNGRVPTVSAVTYQTVNLAFLDGQRACILFPNIKPEVPSAHSDFIIYTPEPANANKFNLGDLPYDTVLFRRDIPSILLKRRPFINETILGTARIEPIKSSELYLNLADIPIDSSALFGAYRVDIEMEARSDHFPLRWWLTTRYDGNEEILGNYYSDLQLGCSDMRNSRIIKTSHVLERSVSSIRGVKVYIQNHRKKHIEVISGEVRIVGIQ